LDEAVHHLTSGDSQARQASFETLVEQLPREVNEWGAQVLSKALEDMDFHEETRAAALKVLAKVAPAGDKQALETFTKCVADRSGRVRSAAIRGLRKMLPEGSEAVVRSLGAYGEAYASSRPTEVMVAALQAIYVLAKGDGGQCTVDMVELFLRSKDKEVSTVAMNILTKLAKRGNSHARDTLRQHRRTVTNSALQEWGYHMPLHSGGQKGSLAFVDALGRSTPVAGSRLREFSPLASGAIRPLAVPTGRLGSCR